MAKGEIIFDADGQRFYETGVEKCALFKHTGVAAAPYGSSSSTDNVGVPWNGITSISESPEGADVTDLYADNRKYLSLQAAENYKTTIEAYTYPDEFMECDGTAQLCTGAYFGQQTRKMFAIAYITKEGNDIEGNAYGEKLHIVYNCKAAPSQRQYQTINDSPEAMTFSWDVSTTPIGFKVGDPCKDDTVDMGPLVEKRALESVTAKVENAIKQGAKVLCGGKPVGGKGYFYPATILDDVKQDFDIVHEETFGPVLPLIEFEDLDQVIAWANDCEYGLASSVFTNDLNTATKVCRELEFGETYINRFHFEGMQGFHAGMKKSGIGGADGKHGIEEYLITHVTYLQTK